MKMKAFTLVELMVVITVISILSGIAVFGLINVRQKAGDTARLSSLRELEIALEAYKSVNGKYPDAGSQSDATSYVTGLTPTFIKKLPVENGAGQSATNGFHYKVSNDKRSYCLYIYKTVYKASSQTDLQKTGDDTSWFISKGTDSSICTI